MVDLDRGNALINNAVIADLDSLGITYVGGEQYSQETLFQSGLISSSPEWAAHDPDALVNEAVAFLDDSMLEAEPTETRLRRACRSRRPVSERRTTACARIRGETCRMSKKGRSGTGPRSR
ncbi:hypothetical protein LZK73_20665 [Neorhizobium galegae]|nr:hypothetical protein LZK73_20665 [Neorhizobium galegae]